MYLLIYWDRVLAALFSLAVVLFFMYIGIVVLDHLWGLAENFYYRRKSNKRYTR